MNELTPDEHNIIVDAIHDSATVIHKGQRMNERIKQLMGQTLDEKFSGTWSTMDLLDLQKFAERFAQLIVAECVDVCLDRHHTWRWDNGPDSRSGPRDCAQSIKEHFGVEE